VNIKIAGKWMFIPLKMVLIGIDPYPYPTINNDLSRVLFFATGLHGLQAHLLILRLTPLGLSEDFLTSTVTRGFVAKAPK
jgi:hypothetical protein